MNEQKQYPVDFLSNVNFRGSVSHVQEMLKYLYDVLEDFVCGPSGEEEWREYHRQHEERRREEIRLKRETAKKRSNIAAYMSRIMKSKTSTREVVYISYEMTEEEKQRLGGDGDRDEYGLEDTGNEYAEIEVGNGLWSYAWYITDIIYDEAPADIYGRMMMNFESFLHPPRWFRQRLADAAHHPTMDDYRDYSQYFHFMAGAIKGLTNASLGVVSRYGFKIYVPDWQEMPYVIKPSGEKHYFIKPVTAEYDNIAMQPQWTHDPNLPFGFQGICWNVDQPYNELSQEYGWVEIANPPVIEGFPPPVNRDSSPDLPNMDNYPGPPGPALDSVYGLSLQLANPKEDVKDRPNDDPAWYRPRWFSGSGLIIDGGRLDPKIGWVDSIMRVYTGGGVIVDSGYVVCRLGQGLQLWPVVVEHKDTPTSGDDNTPKTYSAGGIGIEMQNIQWLRGIFSNLDICDTIIKIAKCLAYIKTVAPCL